MPQRRDPLGLITFVGYSVLAGGNAVGIRFSNQELDPFWGATLRFSVTAALMLMAMKLARQRLPRGRALLGASIYGLLAFGGAFALAFYALVELEAGFGQILLSVVPLLTILLAASQKVESLTVLSLSGALIAVIGVVILSGVTLDGQIPYLSILAALGAAVCFAQASITIKRFPKTHPLAENAVGMTVGAAFLAILTVMTGSEIALPVRTETWLAVGYMVLIGSGVVFTLYVFLVERWDASRANFGFVIVPIVTVLVSAWLLDEELTPGLIGGGLLVLAGVYVGALRQADS